MALVLKRITDFNECVRCDITKKLISYGEEYYEDTEDGFIVDFEYYYDTVLKNKRDAAMPIYEAAMDRYSYQQQLIEQERQFLSKSLFSRQLATQDTSWLKGSDE